MRPPQTLPGTVLIKSVSQKSNHNIKMAILESQKAEDSLVKAKGARRSLKHVGSLGLGFDLTRMPYVSGAQTGCQAHEMEKRVQGATLRSTQGGGLGRGLSRGGALPTGNAGSRSRAEHWGEPSVCRGLMEGEMLRWGLELWLGRGCRAEGSKPGRAHVEAGNLEAEYRPVRGAAGPRHTPYCPIPPYILPFHDSLPGPFRMVLGMGLWTPGVVMNLRGSWTTLVLCHRGQGAQDLSAALPLPRLMTPS